MKQLKRLSFLCNADELQNSCPTIQDLKETGVSGNQLDTEITDQTCDLLAVTCCLGNVETYLDMLELPACSQADIKKLALHCDNETAMAKALKLWRQLNPSAATFRALLKVILNLKKEDVANAICRYIIDEVPKIK